MGRPRTYTTDEARQAARREQNRRAARRYRSARRGPLRFLAVDGEVVGDNYCLLGTSAEAIVSSRYLTSARCLRFLRGLHAYRSILVAFGLGLDVAHWVRDLPDELQLQLWRGHEIEWRGYRLQFLARKVFILRHGKRCRRIYDVQSFFESSFESALERHGIEVPEIVRRGKAARGAFESWTRQELRRYNRAECECLELLMQRLASMMDIEYAPGRTLRPAAWHGPGALAGKVLREEGVGAIVRSERELPEELQDVLLRSYFGGRIEAFGAGTVDRPVWRYDIRSAYPAAIRELPEPTEHWHRVPAWTPERRFAVWRVRWDLRPHLHYQRLPGPFPWRRSDGSIIFRAEGVGWYWTPEVEAALELFPGVEVIDGLAPETRDRYPLRQVVDDLYALRQRLKADGDPRQVVVKLALNSLYGKLAQSVGAARYRSMAWAGYITSWTRAQMLRAMMQDPSAVLAALTDGLLTVRELSLPLGSNLGEWECEQFSSALILAPGVYRLGQVGDARCVERWRGYNVRDFPWQRVVADVTERGLAMVRCPLWVSPALAILAPEVYGPQRRRFIVEERSLTPLVSHKRRFVVPDDGILTPRVDLSQVWVPTELVAMRDGEWPDESAPYRGIDIDPIEQELRDCLESTLTL